MASVDWKYKAHGGGEFSAVLRHCDTEERLIHEHSNPNIDTSLTREKNINFTGASYEQVMERYRERIRTLDEGGNTNNRSDRVTIRGLEIPAPHGMTEEQSAEFFAYCVDLMKERFGGDNIMAAYAHYDEVHEYIDHGELKESRPHLHVYVVPEIDGTLCGKRFSSRQNIISLNKELDTYCREAYGLPFMTGNWSKDRTVEELKALTRAEQKRREKALSLVETKDLQRSPFHRGKVIVGEEELKALKEEAALTRTEREHLEERHRKFESDLRKVTDRFYDARSLKKEAGRMLAEAKARERTLRGIERDIESVRNGDAYKEEEAQLIELRQTSRKAKSEYDMTAEALEKAKKELEDIQKRLSEAARAEERIEEADSMESYMKKKKGRKKGKTLYDEYREAMDREKEDRTK